ncbi:MAG: MMPL family transporter [Acidimicrobiaceae bacterium]|nr:MMPL family transporter [Acidimicrobiaceae bacterium]
MNDLLARLSILITKRPWITIGVLLVITVVMAAGAGRRAPIIDGADVALLPPDSELVAALTDLDEVFRETGDIRVVTLVFRGDALTPSGLAQMNEMIDEIVSQPNVGALLTTDDAILSPSFLARAALAVDDLSAVTQDEIDAVRESPRLGAAMAALTGTDADGTGVAIATIRLLDTDDEQVEEAERLINTLAADQEGPLAVSSVSPATVEDEYRQALNEGMAPLIGAALLLIMLLILLFLRSASDLALTLVGLLISLIWVVGIEGWLGPDALSAIGPPSSLSALVPIIVIALTVDYAIQVVSHFREQRAGGAAVLSAVQTGWRTVVLPLLLAAVTTMVSLLANLLSPVGASRDFGVVAALGVGLSLIVMLTLLPAGRVIIDRRREARGTLRQPRLVAHALPGIERAAERLGESVSLRPAPFLLVVVALTIVLGFAAASLEAKFSIRDVLPQSGEAIRDLNTLEASVGGSTEVTSVLIKAEATETSTLLNLRTLAETFDTDASRPLFAAGALQTSFERTLTDWVSDSGEPGDRYDPELAMLFAEATASLQLDAALMQQVLDQLEQREPQLSQYLDNDPTGIDTILVQFPTYLNDSEGAQQVQQTLESLWPGVDASITATSESLVAVSVTDSITERQTEAISITIAVALGLLVIFYWVTQRQPVLGLVAVVPLVFVLIWVLGTMALLGIPYSLITSIIAALSIGIGIDYTIHLIHRYREEFSRVRDPEQAAIRTLATTGSALLGSAMTTALGLGVLIASPLAGSQQFGITAAITIAYSLIAAILVVPPAMTVWGAFQNMRLRSNLQRMWDELDEAIDDIQERHERESPAATDGDGD